MIATAKDKARDLQDRSRRDNLVFYGVPEQDNEECDKLVCAELMRCKFELTGDTAFDLFERAHRLGSKAKWNKDTNPNKRPRPIIVKMSFHRDKQAIIRQAWRLKNSHTNVSEDYSKETLDVHRPQLQKSSDFQI